MYILGICNAPEVMKIVRIVNIVISIIKIVVPILLILSLSLTYMGAVSSQDAQALNNVNKSAVPKIIAAVIIFLVPTFIKIVTSLVDSNSEYIDCMKNISTEEIAIAFENRMEELIQLAENNLDKESLNNAKIYLPNIKDYSLRLEYEEKLKLIEEEIAKKEESEKVDLTKYDDKDYSTGTFKYIDKTSSLPGYGIYVPDNAGSTPLPLIVWLHGSGEVGTNTSGFLNSGLLGVVSNWSTTGLKNIGAIIIAPKLTRGDWTTTEASTNVKNLIDETINEQNINTKKIVLMGHSLGGIGVVHVGYTNKEYFSALVILSGYNSSPGNAEKTEYFKNIPLRGYSDSGTVGYMKSFFSKTNHSDDLFKLGSSHGMVPKVAMSADNDKDGVSDLVYWMLSQYKK